jgi:hypothetical protein
MLYTYVIKEPKYLETDKAIKLYDDELKSELKNKPATNKIQEKLRKLKELKDNNLITVEDYENKKKQILENL